MHIGVQTFFYRLLIGLAVVFLAAGTWGCDGLEPEGERSSDRGEPRAHDEDTPSQTSPENRKLFGTDVRCYGTFPKFKSAMQKQGMGKKGRDYHWHHIVAQHADNKSKFGEKNLHCTDNLVYIHKDEHTKLNVYYSEKKKKLGERSLRDWLKPMSFEEQHAHGRAAMRELETEIAENPGVSL